MHFDPNTATLDPASARGHTDARTLHLTVLAHWHPEVVGSWIEIDHRTGIALSRAQPAFAPHGLPLGDPYLSRRPVHITAVGTLGVQIDCAGTSTAVRVDGSTVTGRATVDPDRLVQGIVIELADRVALLLQMRPPIVPESDTLGLLGISAAMSEVRRRVKLVADLDVPVLIRGGSGAGKELVAQAIHRLGKRAQAPLVAVNMAAVSPQLAGSTLFGHRKGAFSGATTDHDGHFVMADGGTLFLDEIGECPPAVQVLLLRTLETGKVRAVGGRQERAVNVRVIAATDADLEGGVADGRFRGPLLHRLAGFVLPVAALTDRREDIGLLATHFAMTEQRALGNAEPPTPQNPHLPAPFIAALVQSNLSGNVRQLKNIIRQWVILQRDGAHAVDWQPLVPAAEVAAPVITGPAPSMPPRSYRSIDDVTEDELVDAMRTHRYQAKAAAAALGVSRTALYGRLERSTRVRKAKTLTAAEIEAAAAQHGNDPTAMADALGVSRPALLRRMGALGLR